ncbi:hypothetical protein AHAS_Ahas07G0053800 [Arachis hypogaea]
MRVCKNCYDMNFVVIVQYKPHVEHNARMLNIVGNTKNLQLSSENFEIVKDVGRNDLAALIDSSQEVAKKSLEKAAECVRCLEEDMAKAR